MHVCHWKHLRVRARTHTHTNFSFDKIVYSPFSPYMLSHQSGLESRSAGGSKHGIRGGTGRALLELMPHKMAMCHLVQIFALPA